MTSVKSIKKGDKFWCLGQGIETPTLGTVIALTTNPTKTIGLQFETKIAGHSCDGRGPEGYCLWVRPDDILTEEEYEAKKATEVAIEEAVVSEDIEVLEIN